MMPLLPVHTINPSLSAHPAYPRCVHTLRNEVEKPHSEHESNLCILQSKVAPKIPQNMKKHRSRRTSSHETGSVRQRAESSKPTPVSTPNGQMAVSSMVFVLMVLTMLIITPEEKKKVKVNVPEPRLCTFSTLSRVHRYQVVRFFCGLSLIPAEYHLRLM